LSTFILTTLSQRIHRTKQDRQNKWQADCTFGDGWYCSDNEDISGWGTNDLDWGFIKVGCSCLQQVSGSLKYDAWFCNEDLEGKMR